MTAPYLQLSSERNFILLALGRLFKTTGMTLFSIEIIWLTMSLTHNSATALSIIAMAQTVPFIIFGIYGGVLADKWNKKKMLIFSDIFSVPILILIPILLSVNSKFNTITYKTTILRNT